MAATISFDLIGNATSAISAFKKTTEASKTAAGSAENTGSSFKKIAAAVATGYAVTKVVSFAKESISAASSVKLANKALTQTFALAGDSTGALAKHAIELADSFGRQAGISPQVIKGAEGILATFHQVSNAGAVNAGVFDRATKAAADLAAAGFGDLTGNAKLLGKALSDPVKYTGALGRAGIVLTASQKEQIAAMVKQGNLLGAQKTLLGDVEARVGGMAAKTATAGAKTGVAYEEMKAKLGTSLLPAVKQAQTVMASFFNFVSQNASWLVPLAAGIMGVVAAIRIWMAVQAMLNFVMAANPVVLIILAIVALVAIIVVIATKTRWFQDIWAAMCAAVSAAWRAVSSGVVAAWNWLWGIIQAGFSWIRSNWPLLLGIVTGPIGLAVVLVIKYWSQITSGAQAVVSAIGRFFAMVFGYITAPFIAAYNAVVGFLGRIPGYVGGVVASVGRFFAGVYGAMIGPFQSAISWIGGVPGRIGSILSGVVGAVAGAVAGVFNAIISPFQRAADFINSSILGPLRGAWNHFAGVINGVSISTPAVSIAGHDIIPAFHWTPPWRIPTLAQGGLLIRSGLVYAHAGEVISPAPAAATNARPEAAVRIEHATFSQAVDLDLLTQRMAWALGSGRL